MDELPRISPGLDVIRRMSTGDLAASLDSLLQHQDLWLKFDAWELVEIVVPKHGRAAVAALHQVMRDIIAQSGKSEAEFLTRREAMTNDPVPTAVSQWADTRRSLYHRAIGPMIHKDEALDFVRDFREKLNCVVEIAVPRLEFWSRQDRPDRARRQPHHPGDRHRRRREDAQPEQRQPSTWRVCLRMDQLRCDGTAQEGRENRLRPAVDYPTDLRHPPWEAGFSSGSPTSRLRSARG